MTPHTRKLALITGISMALAACGSGEDGASSSSTPPPVSKQVPKNNGQTGNSQNTDTGTNTADASTGATMNTPPIQIQDGITRIRGDLLIQALLTQVGQRDAEGRLQPDRLAPQYRRYRGPDNSDFVQNALTGPVALLTKDAGEDTGGNGLGQYVYRMSLSHEEIPSGQHDWEAVHSFQEFSTLFSVSLPGLPKTADGSATSPITQPLEIGNQLKLVFSATATQDSTQSGNADAGTRAKAPEVTLTSDSATTIDPKQYYVLDGGTTNPPPSWEQRWQKQDEQRTVTLSIDSIKDKDNQFSICVRTGFTADRSNNFMTDTTAVCDRWEVPASWTSGQPLRSLGHTLEITRADALQDTRTHWTWEGGAADTGAATPATGNTAAGTENGSHSASAQTSDAASGQTSNAASDNTANATASGDTGKPASTDGTK